MPQELSGWPNGKFEFGALLGAIPQYITALTETAFPTFLFCFVLPKG